jgi:hypothetical protein
MNVVEKEAINFFDRKLFSSSSSLEGIKSTLESKLFDFKRDRDKLDFLKILHEKTVIAKEEHAKNCNGCGFDDTRNKGLFAIDQEIESINEYYIFKAKSEDSFTVEQESKLHSKINEIIEKLENLGVSQEVIFNEIDELKAHFNLGKKNWFQLVKGKLFDIGIAYGVEKIILEDVYSDLAREVESVTQVFLSS